jgi:hypothetical protein
MGVTPTVTFYHEFSWGKAFCALCLISKEQVPLDPLEITEHTVITA